MATILKGAPVVAAMNERNAALCEQLKAKGIKHVILMPMMMVAGDHANNDMAGADADSHKSILEKEGFTVTTYIHGLGENEAVRQMFVERADEAWNALEAQ